MRAFARIVICGAIAAGLLLGAGATGHAANYMYTPSAAEQLLESQKREAALTKKLSQQEAANAALESRVDAADKLNKSLSEENGSLTAALRSTESSMAALAATNQSLEREVAALKAELARLLQTAPPGPFDLSDPGHALLALTALLTGLAIAAGSAYAIWRRRIAGPAPDVETDHGSRVGG